MQLQNVPINQVIPYARNPRKNEQAIAKVAASLKEFGWKQPIVVDKENVIVVGHTRWMAAQQLGFKEVPIVIANDLTPAQIKAYRLADNRSHEEAKWDNELLTLELSELGEMDIDLNLTAFDSDEIAKLLNTVQEGLIGEDTCPELTEQPISVVGDIWILGQHRVMCGDSTHIDAVEKLMAGEKADLVFTDPPYTCLGSGS